ncbi:sugar kinase [Siphonobacter sp. SORGH_AS_0500]|uniref:ROK family protein n=1 Tax=Siphonobacter sp. SORGH_AS_0500 TaxID=1864824 RepID=UPI000CCA9E7C|nr:ROK family protein [Siphonobacter sp. SORGH_AS_0500]PKK35640.1 sugar kinase [Siphonobacter sp. SORGH_AS_0500]
MNNLWGIDLGGTKIECAVLDANNITNVRVRRRVPTEADKGYKHILSQIEKLVKMVTEELGEGPQKIGFATPGTLDPVTQTMRGCNTVVMNDQPMQKDLEALLGIPCMIANDANCFALAEAVLGAAPKVHENPQVVFGIIMGTGVGGGVVINGKVWGGRQGIGGEWGHIFLDNSGGPCYCGNHGCVETVLSGPSLQRFYKEESGSSLSMPDILARYQDGSDPLATATVERMLNMFGKAISIITNLLDPDVIVIGGGVSNIDLLYTEGVERARKHVFTPKPDLLIVKNELGDSAGVFGAALL